MLNASINSKQIVQHVKDVARMKNLLRFIWKRWQIAFKNANILALTLYPL